VHVQKPLCVSNMRIVQSCLQRRTGTAHEGHSCGFCLAVLIRARKCNARVHRMRWHEERLGPHEIANKTLSLMRTIVMPSCRPAGWVDAAIYERGALLPVFGKGHKRGAITPPRWLRWLW
jgi:hypothetical protein